MIMKSKLYLATIAEDAGQQALEHGLGLELDDFCTAANMDDPGDLWHNRTRAFLAQSDRFILHAPFAEIHPCAIDPMIRQVAIHRLNQAAEICKRYDIRRMVIHSGFLPRVYFPVWFVEQGAAFFREFLKNQPQDFEIMIENVLDPDPQPLLDLVSAINDPRANLCLDVGHANVASEIPMEEWIRILAPKLTHLHIHDNDGSWDTHSIPGDGTIGYPALFDRILSAAPQATMTLECLDAGACAKRLREYNFI